MTVTLFLGGDFLETAFDAVFVGLAAGLLFTGFLTDSLLGVLFFAVGFVDPGSFLDPVGVLAAANLLDTGAFCFLDVFSNDFDGVLAAVLVAFAGVLFCLVLVRRAGVSLPDGLVIYLLTNK